MDLSSVETYEAKSCYWWRLEPFNMQREDDPPFPNASSVVISEVDLLTLWILRKISAKVGLLDHLRTIHWRGREAIFAGRLVLLLPYLLRSRYRPGNVTIRILKYLRMHLLKSYWGRKFLFFWNQNVALTKNKLCYSMCCAIQLNTKFLDFEEVNIKSVVDIVSDIRHSRWLEKTSIPATWEMLRFKIRLIMM